MKKTAVFCVLVLSLFACSSEAKVRRSSGQTNYKSTSYGSETSTAQGVANIMARLGRVGHFGGNRGYEGCGSGSTPHQAEMNCCYRRSMQPKEVGYARAANGTWYCCCRY